ncbi:hypothetical protein DL95DRAFT_483982 [Leptodontidium sp. 2 PMI_412]|nr:hypothetical protein DL95DRAFT_483982 [Leptodontidium sp. 2 PMI_412]
MTAPSWNSDQEFAGLVSIMPMSGSMAPNRRDMLPESPRSVRCLKQNILVVRKKRRSVFDSLATPDRFAKRARTSDPSLDATSQSSKDSEDGSSSKSNTELDTHDEAQINVALEAKFQEMNIELKKAASDVSKIGAAMQDALAELAQSEEREAGLREASKNKVTETTVNVLRDENDRLRTNLRRQELDHYRKRQSPRQTRIELQVRVATLNDQRDENDDLRFDLNLLGYNRDQERNNLKQTRKQLEESRQRETALQEANTGSNIPGSHPSAEDLMLHNEQLIQLLTRSKLSNHAVANGAVPKVSKKDSDAEKKNLEKKLKDMTSNTVPTEYKILRNTYQNGEE